MCDNKQPITIVRGTTNGFTVAITDETTGEPYVLESGEVIRFGVKSLPTDTDYIFTHEVSTPNEDGEYAFTIVPSNTINMSFGTYWYDVGLQSGDAYYNIIPASQFNLAYNVTEWEA